MQDDSVRGQTRDSEGRRAAELCAKLKAIAFSLRFAPDTDALRRRLWEASEELTALVRRAAAEGGDLLTPLDAIEARVAVLLREALPEIERTVKERKVAGRLEPEFEDELLAAIEEQQQALRRASATSEAAVHRARLAARTAATDGERVAELCRGIEAVMGSSDRYAAARSAFIKRFIFGVTEGESPS